MADDLPAILCAVLTVLLVFGLMLLPSCDLGVDDDGPTLPPIVATSTTALEQFNASKDTKPLVVAIPASNRVISRESVFT